LAKLELKNP